MSRQDSYLAEIEVGENEQEDSVVRRYLTEFAKTGVLQQLQSKKFKETKVQREKRELRERHERRKLRRMGVWDERWQELYGNETEQRPFDEFFADAEDDQLDAFGLDGQQSPLDQELDIFSNFNGSQFNAQGGYMSPAFNEGSGGFSTAMGGYMTSPGYDTSMGSYSYGNFDSAYSAQQQGAGYDVYGTPQQGTEGWAGGAPQAAPGYVDPAQGPAPPSKQ